MPERELHFGSASGRKGSFHSLVLVADFERGVTCVGADATS